MIPGRGFRTPKSLGCLTIFIASRAPRGRSFEGTGIGLSLVRELVKVHGGLVRVESAIGKGSTFTVSIPLGKAHLPQDQVAGSRRELLGVSPSGSYLQEALRWLPASLEVSADSAIAMTPTEKRATSEADRDRILLADDNADMREYVSQLLSPVYEVHTVSNGAEAIAAMRELRPDLVVADIMMPGMDGFEFLQAVRDNPSTRTIPVIFLSARAGEESKVEGFNAGADDYLVKPFSARELLAKVGAHLNLARIRQRAAEPESRLAAIVESSDDAIISKNLSGIIQSWNAAASRMFGYAPEEVIGQSILVLIPPELHAEEAGIMAKLAAGQRIEHYETQRMHKNGQRLDLSLTISPVRDASGRVVGASKIARDISERKKTAEALRVGEQLASVGRMAATMAHEINNPLEAVVNLLYLAASDPSLPEASRRYLWAADQELTRVAHITKQTLGFYRESTTPQVTRVSEIFDSLLLLYAAKIRNKKLQVEISVPDDMEITVVRGELGRFWPTSCKIVLMQCRLVARFDVRVTRRHREPGHEDMVQITIADNGTGIAEVDHSRIFEPFFTTKKDVGTGLGLWVCKGIVQRHGGQFGFAAPQPRERAEPCSLFFYLWAEQNLNSELRNPPWRMWFKVPISRCSVKFSHALDGQKLQ